MDAFSPPPSRRAQQVEEAGVVRFDASSRTNDPRASVMEIYAPPRTGAAQRDRALPDVADTVEP